MLTARERTVLQYLPTMLTVSEFAAELFVSVNTVKSDQSIYASSGYPVTPSIVPVRHG